MAWGAFWGLWGLLRGFGKPSDVASWLDFHASETLPNICIFSCPALVAAKKTLSNNQIFDCADLLVTGAGITCPKNTQNNEGG